MKIKLIFIVVLLVFMLSVLWAEQREVLAEIWSSSG